jgi:flagellar biosynthesis repressor protein FlbT
MALRIDLKPRERILIGDCVITNSDQRTRFLVDGRVPILREKNIMTAKRADTPAKRIYLAVQLMYTAHDQRRHHETYFALLRDFLQAAPSSWPIIEGMNNRILTGDLYNALKDARQLIKFEQELVTNERRRTGLRKRGNADRQPA